MALSQFGDSACFALGIFVFYCLLTVVVREQGKLYI